MPRGRKIVKTIELEECKLRTAAEEFFKHNKVRGLAEETQKTYIGYVNCFIKWYGENELLSNITSKRLEDYAEKKMLDGNKAVSVATNMVHLKRFFNFCISRNYMDEIEVIVPKYEIELKDPYTEREMELLLKKPITNNWVELRNWVMVNYFYSTGQRLSTVLNIKVCDLALEDRRVRLKWNKDKIQKWMPLSTSMITILREYIAVSALSEEDYLFPEYEGGKLKSRSAEDAIADYNKSRGVYKTSIHLFRHTFAKDYIMAGGNPVKLQKLMNHKTIDTTMNYVKLYSTDILSDVDMFNPLDQFKHRHHVEQKRRKLDKI